ncbi:PRC-barrel domain-containing protein [Pedobacter fastidiosus]|uniref:PRC-barrel domain-containing protein n=1 Tax=Pedobacter fastidiosus TaxID=2765361 RepID=A0ABR7KXM8_9SPHI|nr:PRC-barrel domain-containing protein [Pedobacter fastidiosus]MBC6112832.1 PRC-barrel domain-containing protein [Pedobacter fastidiosus]
MNTGIIEYINLEELSRGDYKIIDGETDITGWPVIDESENTVGKVRDLLFDPEQNAIRYIIVDLDESIVGTEDKAVLMPIGFANLGIDKKEVVIPVLHESQYAALPQYIIGEITRETEMKIRTAIGSPAALRIEEEISEMDPSEFYNHHHFDRGRLSASRDSHTAEHNETVPSDNREEEINTIHELIEHSGTNQITNRDNDHQVADKFEAFEVNTQDGKFTIEPQENGTYRILDKGEKIGVIYAEAGERGVQWRTMDQLDERFVEAIGEGITTHNLSV